MLKFKDYNRINESVRAYRWTQADADFVADALKGDTPIEPGTWIVQRRNPEGAWFTEHMGDSVFRAQFEAAVECANG